MDRVSVIIPAYGTEKYIGKCLKSVIDQTYTNLEIIVIDDGSLDNLYKIVERYADLDARVKLIRQKNKGLSGARNRGVDVSKGKYILFLDSDDWLESNAIELLVNKAIMENSDIIMPDRFTKVDLDGHQTEELLFVNYSKYKTIEDFVVNVIIGQGRGWRATSVLYKSEIIRRYKVNFPEGYTAEDIIFNLSFLSNAKKISFIRYSTLNVNKRTDSITATYREDLFEIYLFIDKKSEEYVKKTKYNKKHGNIAINSLLCRNIILLITSEMSKRNIKEFKEKKEEVYDILENNRVQESFRQDQFIKPYWNSSLKTHYVILMRFLIKYKLKRSAILLAIISNCVKD